MKETTNPCTDCKRKNLCENEICDKKLDFIMDAAEYARRIVALHPDTPAQIAIYKEIMKEG